MFSTIGYAICIPFAALLRLFYNLTGSYGVSLILFTLVIKLILLPFKILFQKENTEGIDANQTTAIREDKTKKTGIKHPHDEAEDAFYSVEEKK